MVRHTWSFYLARSSNVLSGLDFRAEVEFPSFFTPLYDPQSFVVVLHRRSFTTRTERRSFSKHSANSLDFHGRDGNSSGRHPGRNNLRFHFLVGISLKRPGFRGKHITLPLCGLCEFPGSRRIPPRVDYWVWDGRQFGHAVCARSQHRPFRSATNMASDDPGHHPGMPYSPGNRRLPGALDLSRPGFLHYLPCGSIQFFNDVDFVPRSKTASG